MAEGGENRIIIQFAGCEISRSLQMNRSKSIAKEIDRMSYVDEVLSQVAKKNASEPEFLQAVKEVLESLRMVVEAHEDEYRRDAVLERIVEPDRQVKFKVQWVDDKGQAQVNTGYRIQFNNSIGP